MAKVMVSIGMVNFEVTVRPVGASHDTTVSSIHAGEHGCGQKIRSKPPDVAGYCETCEKVLQENDIGKGVKIAKGQYVQFSRDEIDVMDTEVAKVNIEQFVPVAMVPILQREKAYMMIPGKGAGKAYQLLSDGMKTEKRVGVGFWQTRTKIHLVCVAPVNGSLVCWHLFYADEFRAVPEIPAPQITPQERAMSKQVIDAYAGETPLTEYVDRTEAQIQELVEARMTGKPLPKPIVPQESVDVLKAMQATVLAKAGKGAAEPVAQVAATPAKHPKKTAPSHLRRVK